MKENLEAIISDEVVKMASDDFYYGKYLVAKARKDGQLTYLFVVSRHEYHDEIYNDLCAKQKKRFDSIEPAGGGSLSLEMNRKYISLYDVSGTYGEPNPKLLKKLVDSAFPDYEKDLRYYFWRDQNEPG